MKQQDVEKCKERRSFIRSGKNANESEKKRMRNAHPKDVEKARKKKRRVQRDKRKRNEKDIP